MSIRIREKVRLDSIPIAWDTNLSDEDIKSFYLILVSDSDFSGCKVEVSGFLSISIRLFQKAIPFKDGWCECRGLSNWFQVVYRSAHDWELFQAREREIEEFSEERNSKFEIATLLFEVEDDALIQQSKEMLARGDYEKAAIVIGQRMALVKHVEKRSRTDGLRNFSVVSKTYRNAVDLFVRFPVSEPAISFFKDNADSWWDYYTFGRDYFFEHFQKQRTAVEQTDRVFRTAVRLFPSESKLYKTVCLFWKRNKQLGLAIEYCQLACDMGLQDDTQKGFAYRLERLAKMAKGNPVTTPQH